MRATYEPVFISPGRICGYYVNAFILYVQGIFVPRLQAIALLFGFGIVLDMLTMIALFRLVKCPLK